MRLFLRESRDCKSGTSYYVCSSIQYRGCCSVDACHRKGCPDNLSVSTTITLTVASATSTATKTSILPILTASPLAPTISPSSSPSPSQVFVVTASTQVTSNPSITASTDPKPTETDVSGTSHSSKTPIIAGSVSGVVVLGLVAALIWFCLRRRRIWNLSGGASTEKFAPPQKPSYFRTSMDEERIVRASDPFAPFGGYQRTSPRPQRRVSDESTLTHDLAAASLFRQRQEDAEDQPLPDLEKSSMSSPPLNNHPALHPLPGESPQVPVFDPNRTDSSQQSTQQQGTPVAKQSKVSSQRRSFAQRAAEDQNGSISTLPSQRRNRNTTQNIIKNALQRRSYVPLQPQQEIIKNPRKVKSATLPTVNSFPISPIPGRSELPAVVPQELSDTSSRIYYPRRKGSWQRDFQRGVLKVYSPSMKQPSSLEPLIEQIPAEADIGLQSPNSPDRAAQRVQSPAYYVSPRSAQSPDLGSTYYQSHIVSPDVTSPPSATGQFKTQSHKLNSQPHIAQFRKSYLGDTPRVYKPTGMPRSTHTPSPPSSKPLPSTPVRQQPTSNSPIPPPKSASRSSPSFTIPPPKSTPRSRSSNSPQPSLRLDTSSPRVRPPSPPPIQTSPTTMTTTRTQGSPLLPKRRSRSPILRNQALIRDNRENTNVRRGTLGKGRDHATAWATYGGRHSNGSGSTGSTPPNTGGLMVPEPTPSTLNAASVGGGGVENERVENEGETTPISESPMSKYPTDESSARWSGSTATATGRALLSEPSSPVDTITVAFEPSRDPELSLARGSEEDQQQEVEAEDFSTSPSCYSQDCSTWDSTRAAVGRDDDLTVRRDFDVPAVPSLPQQLEGIDRSTLNSEEARVLARRGSVQQTPLEMRSQGAFL